MAKKMVKKKKETKKTPNYPDKNLKEKYKIWNWVLVFLLIWFAITYTISNLARLIQENAPLWIALFGLILPVIAIIFTIKCHRWVYPAVAVFALILIVQGLIIGYPWNILILSLILILSIFLAIKLFPRK